MCKRYVFWRMPNGKAYTGNDEKQAPRALLAALPRSATFAANSVMWRGLGGGVGLELPPADGSRRHRTSEPRADNLTS